MKKIEIYHLPERGIGVSTILSEGLKSEEELIFEGKLDSQNAGELFKNHLSIIYFQWFPPHVETNGENIDWVSIKVDPEMTSVFNRELGYHNDMRKYVCSKMSLADYISKHERSKAIRQHLELGTMIVWNPLTAEPTIIRIDDDRAYDSRWQYSNEIPIQRSIIPPSELERYCREK